MMYVLADKGLKINAKAGDQLLMNIIKCLLLKIFCARTGFSISLVMPSKIR